MLDTGHAVVNHPMVGETAASPGEMRHWLASCHPVQIADETIGIGIVVVDVTEQHQAEEFRSVVVDNMAEGLFTLDAKGRLMSMNAAATSMLGWTEAELHGQPVHGVIHFQHADGSPLPEEECELLKVRIQARTVRMANEAFTRKDGSIFSVAYSAAPLVSGRKVHGVVAVFRDVTEEKTENSRAYRESAALTWMGTNSRGHRSRSASSVFSANPPPHRRGPQRRALATNVGSTGRDHSARRLPPRC